MVKYTCEICKKDFSKKDNFIKHTIKRKKSCQPFIFETPKNTQILENEIINNEEKEIKPVENIVEIVDKEIYQCHHCNLILSRRDALTRHINFNCKEIKMQKEEKEKERDNKLYKLLEKEKEKNLLLEGQLKETKEQIEDLKNKIDKFNETNKENILEKDLNILNKQLVNIIINKDAKIDNFKNNSDTKIINSNNANSENKDTKLKLIINDNVIDYRESDNYINAKQLCKAGGKKFSKWFCLDSTIELINELGSNICRSNILNKELTKTDLINNNDNDNNNDFYVSQLVNYKKENKEIWIHPDLAIQLAQWINPKFTIQVSSWLRTLYITGKVEFQSNLIKEKEDIIKKSESKIKLLENIMVKKQKRKDYLNSNVIYLLTTESHKKDNIYIIGKAKNLTNRLSTYNKTCEHEVIYYKSCETEDQMDLVEKLVLKKLEKYKEKANRDRFILPPGSDIKLFTNIIDKSVSFISS